MGGVIDTAGAGVISGTRDWPFLLDSRAGIGQSEQKDGKVQGAWRGCGSGRQKELFRCLPCSLLWPTPSP